MTRRFDTLRDLPGSLSGRRRVVWRGPAWQALAAVAAAAWPPMILTLLIWPPQNWQPGSGIDWRLLVLAVGLIAAPTGLWLLKLEQRLSGRPGSRLGVVWRLMLYGGLLAAGLQVVVALVTTVMTWFQTGDFLQAMGASETVLLLLGVVGLPVAILMGVSYALWAGLCIAFIAFAGAPPPVRDRLGLLPETNGQGD